MHFVHLHNHSHYSLLDGLTKIEDMVARAKELGMDAIALTDHGNLYGAIEFYQKAKKAEIKPILGVEAYVAPGARTDKSSESANGASNGNGRLPYYHLILLAKNETGWTNLMKLVSRGFFEGFYYKPRVDKELLREYHEGLIALSACLTGEIQRFLLAGRYEDAKRTALEYRDIFGPDDFYLEIGIHPHIPDMEKVNAGLLKLSKDTGIPLVATQDAHYLKKEDAEFHDILLAIQTGNKLTDTDRLTLKDDDFSLRSSEEMIELFSAYGGSTEGGKEFLLQAIENTGKIADACNLELQLGKVRLPSFPLPPEETAETYLTKLAYQGLEKKYRTATPELQQRLEYELGIIHKMGYDNYFLIVQDYINWAKDYGIVVGPGRGSAAGSLVAYTLGITAIDPIKFDLYFERFLNPERAQMPDIDTDFTDRRRDEVLNYVKEKYGEDKVAQIITFGTMAARAAIRDAGRALGMSYTFCDQIAKLIPFNPTQGMKVGWLDKCLENVGELKALYANDPQAKRLIDAARKLEGVARHASVHASGVVISKDPLMDIVPLQFSPQDPNAIITQFEMHSIEDLGLLKMDFLGLKNLTIIEDTLRLVRDLRNEEVDISNVPLDDKKTYELLQRADMTGVFQFESAGMRRYMKEMQPTELGDLIALVALYRPGPIELIPSYIKRKHGEETIEYIHPVMESILKETYGVIVYQEQVMAMATGLAGFTKGEGYLLIKAVAKKIKSLLDEQKEKFIAGCLKNNIPQTIANKAWELIEPFARYGFNKAHSACYALIGYQTAYLKAHYPVESMTALMNADSGDTERMAFLVSEAKKGNIEVLPPDIQKSLREFVPDGANIRFGLLAVKNVGAAIVDAIVEERARGGPFKDMTDFLERIEHKDLNKKSLEALLKCGAFDSLGIERNEGLQNMDEILKFIAAARRSRADSANSLFGMNHKANSKLVLKSAPAATQTEKLAWEKELMGLYVSDHPLRAHEAKIKASMAKSVKDAVAIKNERLRFTVAGIISSVKKIATKNGQPMIFATLADMHDSMEVIVFSDSLQKNPIAWQENKVLVVSGRMSARNGEYKMICEGAKELI